MRKLAFLCFVVIINGCTCLGCGAKEAAPAPTPPPPAPVAVIDAGPRELPYEVKQGAPDREKLVALFTEQCTREIEIEFDDMEGPRAGGECRTIAFDQNCAPDTFGCFDGVVKCRENCSEPCLKCQQACGTSCDGCKAKCGQDAACLKSCAEARADCWTNCLYDTQDCRAKACNAQYQKCEDDADARVKKTCPDCEKIRQCLLKSWYGDGGPADACLLPGNAKECFEWCGAD
ncbi:MAG: hypothetical protein U0228_23245 [Myxococcaceae bacterium]